MMACTNIIYEYLVEFTKRRNDPNSNESNKKRKTIRFLSSDRTPYMQVISTKNKEKKIPQIDISQCAAAFNGFYNGLCIKIILKSKIYSLYFDEQRTRENCFERINGILHNHRQLGDLGISFNPEKLKDHESVLSEKSKNRKSNIQLEDSYIQPKYNNEVTIQTPRVICEDPRHYENLDNSRNTYVSMHPISDSTLILTLPTFLKTENLHPDKNNTENMFELNYLVPAFIFDPTVVEEEIDLKAYELKMKDSYKDSQIIYMSKLRKESLRENGIKIHITKDIIHELNLVEIDKKLWVSLIKSEQIKENFYVGDRIVSVNETRIETVSQFQEILKSKRINKFYLIVQRLPYAKLFVFDKKKSDIRQIVNRNKKWFFNHPSFISDTQWQICEINQVRTVGIPNSDQISNIVSVIISQNQNICLIIQQKTFIDKLQKNFNY